MRQGKSSQEANRLKKQRRMQSKKDLRLYYTEVYRVPLEGKKAIYTKIVNDETADKLINGKPTIVGSAIIGREKLSREFRKVS